MFFDKYMHKEGATAVSNRSIRSTQSSNQGGDLARLVQMRLAKARNCSCERCCDFLYQVHSDALHIAKEHGIEQNAISYWLNRDNADGLPYGSHHDRTSGEVALKFLTDNESFFEQLLRAEKDWLKQTKTDECKDSDDFWIQLFKDNMERIKRAKGS